MEFILNKNYPNPFQAGTNIVYTIQDEIPVKLVVTDLLGNTVAILVNEMQMPGKHELFFDASDLPGGAYFLHGKAGNQVKTRKMIKMY
jgi:hypothetical protein